MIAQYLFPFPLSSLMSLCTNVTLMDCARHIWIRSDIKYDEDIWRIAEKTVKYWSCVNCSAKTKWRVAQKGRVCLITFANVWEWLELLEIVDLSTAVIRLYNRVHSFSRCDDNMFRAAHRHLPNFAQFRCSFRQFSFSKFCFLQISVCSANCLPFAIFAKVCLFKRRQIEWNRDFGRQLSRARSAGTAKKRELAAKCRTFSWNPLYCKDTDKQNHCIATTKTNTNSNIACSAGTAKKRELEAKCRTFSWNPLYCKDTDKYKYRLAVQ